MNNSSNANNGVASVAKEGRQGNDDVSLILTREQLRVIDAALDLTQETVNEDTVLIDKDSDSVIDVYDTIQVLRKIVNRRLSERSA